MPARERSRLTDAAIARLRPRAREYAVWDARVPGLGVRVRPTGGMTWVMLEDTEGRTRRVSLGPVSTMTVDEARRECHERKARPETERPARLTRAAPTFREFVEGEWKGAHFERCKPTTRKGYSWMLDVRLLPAFGEKRLDRITSAEVGAGSTISAAPRRATPTSRSCSCVRSSTSPSPADVWKPTPLGASRPTAGPG